MSEQEIPDGCDACPRNTENKPTATPYLARLAVAMFAGFILATQCYAVRYGQHPNKTSDDGVEVGQVGQWTIETREPNYLFAAGCAAIAMTALGIKIDSLFKLLPGQK